jgi:hypothetical protein
MGLWVYLSVGLTLSAVVAFYVVLFVDAGLTLRDAWRHYKPRSRLASGGTGSCVAVPSTEVEG